MRFRRHHCFGYGIPLRNAKHLVRLAFRKAFQQTHTNYQYAAGIFYTERTTNPSFSRGMLAHRKYSSFLYTHDRTFFHAQHLHHNTYLRQS